MNLFALSGILGAATSALMAALMFTKFIKIKNKIHFIWGSFCISVIFWDVGAYFLATTKSEEVALFWWKIATLGTIFIPVFFNYFVYSFLEIKNKILIYFSFLIALGFSALLFFKTEYLLKMRWTFGEFFYNYNAGPFYVLLTIFFFSLISIGHYKLIMAYRKTVGIKKLQLKYFFIGTMVGFSGGSFNFLPAYGINFYPILNFTIVVYPLIIGYSIIKYRLMDIRIVIRKFFIYLNVLISSYILFYFFILAKQAFSNNTFEIKSFWTDSIFIPFLVIAVYLLDVLLRKIANKYFFFSLYNYQKTINKVSYELNYYTDLKKIINSIIDTMKTTMQLDRAGVLLVNQKKNPIHYEIAKVVGFNKHNGISLVKDNFLTKHLQKTNELLVRDELVMLKKEAKTKKEKDSFQRLYDHMKKIEASLCLPLLSNQKLIGIVVLGSKVSKDAYTKEDLDLLNTLAYQAGIAVDNANLYKEVDEFNKNLKAKVKEQTRDIQKKASELEEKNNELAELLNMKSDFLRVVNHQLNTPISIMKNSLFMIKDKTFSTEKGLEFIEAGLKRVDETINDFWSAFALEGQKIKMNPEKTDILKLIKELIEEKKNLDITKKRGLEIKIGEISPSDSFIFCDPRQTTQALSNLLDNAIHYTLSGYIKIYFSKKGNDYLKIHIEDTGSGISAEDQKNLFQKFSRGSRSSQFYANGSGLGLYISKKIIDANNGSLILEKTKINEGTTFSISLPTWKEQEGYLAEKIIASNSSLNKKTKDKKIKNIKNILFIEDEKNFSEMYNNYFTKKGYHFIVAEDTKDAERLIEKSKPDLILLDIILPQKNKDGSIANVIAEQGWEFLSQAKRNEKIKNIPIIVFTNLNSERDREKAKTLGANDYILKNNVNPEKLIKIIEKY